MVAFLAKGLVALKQNKDDAAALEAITKKIEAIARFMSLARSGKTKRFRLEQYEQVAGGVQEGKRSSCWPMSCLTGNLIYEEDPSAYERSIDAFVKNYSIRPGGRVGGPCGWISAVEEEVCRVPKVAFRTGLRNPSGATRTSMFWGGTASCWTGNRRRRRPPSAAPARPTPT